MKPCQVRPWWWYQGCQLGDEIQRLENDMRGAIAIRGFQFVPDIAIRGEREALFRNSRAADIAAQPFELGTLIRTHSHTRV